MLQSILSKARINQIFNKYATGDEQQQQHGTMTTSASMSTFKPVVDVTNNNESKSNPVGAQSMESLVKAVMMPTVGDMQTNNNQYTTTTTGSSDDKMVSGLELNELAIEQHSSSSSSSAASSSGNGDSSPASPVSIDSSDDTTAATSAAANASHTNNKNNNNANNINVQLII